MDFRRNISVSGGVPSKSQSEQLLSSSSCSNKLGTLDELFSNHSTAEGDVSLEWLSIFVEDCFSNRGNHCLPPAAAEVEAEAEAEAEAPATNELQKKKTSSVDIIAAASKPRQQQDRSTSSSLQKFVIPVKARSKRKRGPIIKSRTQVSSSCWSHMTGCSSDPPLLQQAYWLADSELILPKKEDDSISTTTTTSSSRDRDGGCGRERGGKDEKEVKEEAMVVGGAGGKDKRGGRRLELVDEGGSNANIGGQQQQARRCSHCLAQRTPQWRAGPLGPKTLCNACGVRFKSGRLLPEYRPAKSPTFVSYKHSNSHKKVLEMRQSSMALHLPPSSIPTQQY